MHAGRAARGFVLMDSLATILILSLSIVALMPLFGMAVKGLRRSEKVLVASHLARELMEEIKLRKWDAASAKARPGPIPEPGPLGPEQDEDKADKRTFDDIDDFDAWEEAPPRDPMMRPLDGLETFRRSVSVTYLDGDLAPSASPTDLKRVRVCVATGKVVWTCLDHVFANR